MRKRLRHCDRLCYPWKLISTQLSGSQCTQCTPGLNVHQSPRLHYVTSKYFFINRRAAWLCLCRWEMKRKATRNSFDNARPLSGGLGEPGIILLYDGRLGRCTSERKKWMLQAAPVKQSVKPSSDPLLLCLAVPANTHTGVQYPRRVQVTLYN